MIIEGYDLINNKAVRLTATMTTEHPASHYGQPVMMIREWENEIMSHSNWVLIGARVLEIENNEKEAYQRWHEIFALMAGGRT